MRGYYVRSLGGERLRRCYELASPRVRRYLEAEVEHVGARLDRSDTVLELGCGYGRVAFQLADRAACVVGIDNARDSIALTGRLPRVAGCAFIVMDALHLGFADASFDAVVCIQNGICAFGVDQDRLLHEAVRVARPGGRVLISSYAAAFWPHRLAWFEAQSAAGLLGPLDRMRTGDGTIVCTDGFRSGMMTPAALRDLAARAGLTCEISEVDGSSVFCEISIERR